MSKLRARTDTGSYGPCGVNLPSLDFVVPSRALSASSTRVLQFISVRRYWASHATSRRCAQLCRDRLSTFRLSQRLQWVLHSATYRPAGYVVDASCFSFETPDDDRNFIVFAVRCEPRHVIAAASDVTETTVVERTHDAGRITPLLRTAPVTAPFSAALKYSQ